MKDDLLQWADDFYETYMSKDASNYIRTSCLGAASLSNINQYLQLEEVINRVRSLIDEEDAISRSEAISANS